MDMPVLREKQLENALLQFIFPFSLVPRSQPAFKRKLREDGYEPFFLDNLDLEGEFYGDFRVSHRNMERYYLPFTNNVLFPHAEDEDAFQRYSRKLNIDGVLRSLHNRTPFRILSADVFLCPFSLGFITVRVQLTNDKLTYTEALEFANRFRVLQDISLPDDLTYVECDGREYKEVEDFIFKVVAASTLPFLDNSDQAGAYFETMPFFVDERMYVQAFYNFPEGTEIDREDLYRAGRIDGLNLSGKPNVSSSNMAYINAYLDKHAYERWAPNTFYVMDENSFCCLTSRSGQMRKLLADQMYGEYYYGLLLNLFHKIVLLKLSNCYSTVRYDRNPDDIEDLIGQITKFSSKYFFLELVTQSQGREIFIQLRKLFGNNSLYEEVKQTLNDLYKYQADTTDRRTSNLIMIFTVYTVISGIYGMNQVIEDLKGPKIDWGVLRSYSLFQYIALVVTITGIATGLVLGCRMTYRRIRIWRRKNRPGSF
ncbi:hypothetical protein [Gorillibacterium timonense]|uniref:hypothetical protein n=1 Tax=Gorillibacterium timonense TaxID=1689269 RepID=UPI00071D50B8|nr:hypothetical protein [Gorillibacterium timonense]